MIHANIVWHSGKHVPLLLYSILVLLYTSGYLLQTCKKTSFVYGAPHRLPCFIMLKNLWILAEGSKAEHIACKSNSLWHADLLIKGKTWISWLHHLPFCFLWSWGCSSPIQSCADARKKEEEGDDEEEARRGKRFTKHEISDVWKMWHLQEIGTSRKIKLFYHWNPLWVGVKGWFLCSELE